MNLIYNTQEQIATKIKSFLLKAVPELRKTLLKIIPYIIIGIILSESIVASDISKHLKDDFSLIQHDSVIKRIKRFFKNKLFNPYFFYDKIIHYVINNYKSRNKNNNVHLVFDHMFSNDNYTVFMITMRIGKQGIPLWFRCFEGNSCSDAFQEELIKEGINYVSNLFTSEDKLIFLADRWFNSISLLQHIDSLGHTYYIRAKSNIKTFYFDKKQGHKIWTQLGYLQSYYKHSNLFYNIEITENRYSVNLVINKRKGVTEPWIIITNGEPKRAIKDYGYRFGGIESVFKNQKANGFYLENTVNVSLKYFESMYCMASIGILYLTILGCDYAKNSKCYKNVKLTVKKANKDNRKIRILSLFNVGLTLFHIAFNSSRYIRLPVSFVLYDI